MTDEPTPLGRRPAQTACPNCGKPATDGFRPFCSRRCRMVDLGRWFGESYAIPGAPAGPIGYDGEGDEKGDDEGADKG
jgi:endogenous inhibitor of DNA gyrase (YacG/DUF329 family)